MVSVGAEDRNKIEYLKFDSEIFGFACGRLLLEGKASADGLRGLLERAKADDFSHLVVKVASEDVFACNLLEDNGFKFKVCSLELEKENNLNKNIVDNIFPYETEQKDSVVEMTKNAFSQGTRFHLEESFKAGKIEELHRQWISNLIDDKDVRIYVHRVEDRVTGYITVKVTDSRVGHIGLFAVAESFKGKGIGAKLLKGAEAILHEELTGLRVVTESINYPALKVYCDSGFRVRRALNVLHLNI